jgi:hypothetical protein
MSYILRLSKDFMDDARRTFFQESDGLFKIAADNGGIVARSVSGMPAPKIRDGFSRSGAAVSRKMR